LLRFRKHSANKCRKDRKVAENCTEKASALLYSIVVEAVTVVDAESVGTIEGAAAGSKMTVLVDVAARPDWSVAT